MSSRGWNIVGAIMLVVAIFMGIGALASGNSMDSVLGRHGDKQSDGTYQCHGNPKTVASDIARDKKPEAQADDPATGTSYLRYGKDVYSVSTAGPTGCLIKKEPRDRVGGGAFIFLGPGFFPSSPSRSSGGTSGGTGVK